MKLKSFAYYAEHTYEQVLQELQTSMSAGLSEDAVIARRTMYGVNELVSKKESVIYLIMRQFHSPIVYLLCGAALLLLFVHSFTEATLLVSIVMLNAIIGFYQEWHSARIFAHLRRLLVTRCMVLRNGRRVLCASRDLVPGDIVFLAAGDRIVADVRIVQAHDLYVDESVLTGESVAIQKISAPSGAVTSPFQAQSICFAGTLVASGSATGVVIATGKKSYFGAVSMLTAETVRLNAFSKDVARFSLFLIRIMIISVVMLFFVRMFLFSSLRINWIDFFVFSVALAVTIIPEALPVVITFCLSQGALLLAHKKVIIKRLSAIEDLGNMEVLCTDKTGTITENNMSIAHIYGQEIYDARMIRMYGFLAASDPDMHGERKGFDAALYAGLSAFEKEQIARYARRAEILFTAEKRFNAVMVSQGSEGVTTQQIIMRGAIEVIMPRCPSLTEDKKNDIVSWVSQEGTQGRRVLAIAIREMSADESFEETVAQATNFIFIGMISFEDPIKPTVIGALSRAKEMGIMVKMLSGDSLDVCVAVAQRVGLINNSRQCITGEQFAKLSIEQQAQAVRDYMVFARILPQEKYTIVQLLQQTYAVGYLGDGINDAPALKIAHVGLAVDEGADIAKDAADIVLLKKSLHVVIDGVEEGRKVFANTLKYIKTSLSSTFGNFYSLGIVSLFIPFVPMLPIQLVLVNFLSDFPMIAIATDTVDRRELKRPGKYNIRELFFLIIIFGLVSSLFDFIFFAVFYHFSPAILQSGWFVESILTELIFFYSMRTPQCIFCAYRPSKVLVIISAIAMLVTLWLPMSFIGQHWLGFAPLTIYHYGLVVSIVLAFLCVSELVKYFYYRVHNHTANGDKQA